MKKVSNKNKKEIPSEVRNIIIILIVIFVLLVSMYFLTTRILEKNKEEDYVVESAIQYDEILAGESFNQNNDEYYVIYFDSTDEELEISSLVSSYQLAGEGIKLYNVDLSSGFNTKYITDKDVVTTDPASLRVKNGTLIKFTNHEVSEVITDIHEIENKLSN